MAEQLKTQDDAAESEFRGYSAQALEKGLDILGQGKSNFHMLFMNVRLL
jgi:hypothetical protein